jgi:phage tail protein X
MGYMRALDLTETGLDLTAQLSLHLSTNHYPALPDSLIPVCVTAIENANDGLWDEEVELPKGISWKGQTTAPTWSVVEAHHLDAWIENN